MKQHIKRREFLKQSSFAVIALSTSSPNNLPSIQDRLQRKGSPKKVIVVGAGLAGLSAAYELTRASHDVTILEARTRPGGRVLTLRAPFSDGLYDEAGAAYIPDSHDWTMRYIKLFDLPLDPIVPSKLASVFYVRGNRIEVRPGEHIRWPFDLTPEEKRLGLAGMREKYVESVVREISNAAAPHWPPAQFKKYDRMTFLEFLREQGASTAAVALLRMGYYDLIGDGVNSYSALHMLRNLAVSGSEKEYAIRGGNDLLPKAFATRLAHKILYGAPVVKIEHHAQGTRVVFLQAGAHQSISADRIICTIPFSVLRQVEVSPKFSIEKQKAIDQLPYNSYARVFLQSRRKFWLEEGLEGRAFTDYPRVNIVDGTSSQLGIRGILRATMGGPEARQMAVMKESERIGFVLKAMEKVHPHIRKNFEGGVSKWWDEDDWARGAYSWFRPGQMTELLPHIGKAEGRVHFAGDHASAWPGWMQGALESGNRAAREVNEATS